MLPAEPRGTSGAGAWMSGFMADLRGERPPKRGGKVMKGGQFKPQEL